MESDKLCFGKLIDITNGTDIYLENIPCVLGRYSYNDSTSSNDSKNLVGKTIDIEIKDSSISNLTKEFNIKSKLILGKCKRINQNHSILYFDFKQKAFKLKPLAAMYLNDCLLNEASSAQQISSFDKISFECDCCYVPHVYIIIFPRSNEEGAMHFSSFANFNDTFNANLHSGYGFGLNFSGEEAAKIASYGANAPKSILNANNLGNNLLNSLSDLNTNSSGKLGTLSAKMPDIALGNKWTNHEKECLRKYILIYGYGRWKIIKHNSRGVLSEKPELELKVFSNAFLKVIIEFLPQEKMELRKFLINLIHEQPDEPFILPKKDDWGTLLKQRAPAWGKRIQLIYRVCLIIEKFKSERKKNKEIRKRIDLLAKGLSANSAAVDEAKEPKTQEDYKYLISEKIYEGNENVKIEESENNENNKYNKTNENINDNIINNSNVKNEYPIENSETAMQLENNENLILEEIEKLKSQINKTFDYWDNLLNFLPNHAFYGQRPSVWWTRTHDIDLLRGTYKHGYANYQLMRSDIKLSFSKLEKDTNFQEFPNADTITRRIKKLIQIIIKSESSNGIISFEDKKSLKEPTGFNLQEKNSIINFLADYGVPLNHEGKSDWTTLRDQLTRVIGLDSSKTPQMVERLVQRIRMISQLVIQLNQNENSNDSDADENMNEQMDPDNDGFNISFEDAERLNKNMNILHYIRKHILSNNSRLFNNGLSSLKESTFPQNLNVANTSLGNTSNCYLPYPYNLPEGWDCGHHDKGLLNAVADNGLNYLHNLSNNKNYNFEKMRLNFEDGLNRVNYLCEFFRDFTSGNKNKKKTLGGYGYSESNMISGSSNNNINLSTSANNSNNNFNFPSNFNQGENYNNNINTNYNSSISINNINQSINSNINNDSNSNVNNRKKISKLVVSKDENGNILYPININSSLRILNLGKICSDKPAYHSEKNLFPIGFKSVREHSSMKRLGERALYTCEILDGGNKPIYKITPHEDPENPIIKESSTGCWIVVCNKINSLQNNKRSKVTISGTERFGLCEQNVVKLLQSLPGVEKCSKYIIKNFDD